MSKPHPAAGGPIREVELADAAIKLVIQGAAAYGLRAESLSIIVESIVAGVAMYVEKTEAIPMEAFSEALAEGMPSKIVDVRENIAARANLH